MQKECLYEALLQAQNDEALSWASISIENPKEDYWKRKYNALQRFAVALLLYVPESREVDEFIRSHIGVSLEMSVEYSRKIKEALEKHPELAEKFLSNLEALKK